MPIVSSYTVARRRQPNHLGCVRPIGRFGARRAQNGPKTPPDRTPQKAYRRRRAPKADAAWRTCLARPQGRCGLLGSDGILSAGAPRTGRCFLAASGRLHPDLGAKMENAPKTKQAASRHRLGQFQPHTALRGGIPVAPTGPTRVATNRSLAREQRDIRVTRPN
jgi:hypothetical protein